MMVAAWLAVLFAPLLMSAVCTAILGVEKMSKIPPFGAAWAGFIYASIFGLRFESLYMLLVAVVLYLIAFIEWTGYVRFWLHVLDKLVAAHIAHNGRLDVVEKARFPVSAGDTVSDAILDETETTEPPITITASEVRSTRQYNRYDF